MIHTLAKIFWIGLNLLKCHWMRCHHYVNSNYKRNRVIKSSRSKAFYDENLIWPPRPNAVYLYWFEHLNLIERRNYTWNEHICICTFVHATIRHHVVLIIFEQEIIRLTDTQLYTQLLKFSSVYKFWEVFIHLSKISLCDGKNFRCSMSIVWLVCN